MISVLLVDDHPFIRMGFRLVLDAEDDIEVIGEAADGTTAVSMCSALRPDVVLMDIRMPGYDGIEATRDIVAAGLPCKVLILTTFDLDDYVYAGLRAGASGFLLKDTQPAEPGRRDPYRRCRRCRPGAGRHHPPRPPVDLPQIAESWPVGPSSALIEGGIRLFEKDVGLWPSNHSGPSWVT